jgi:ribosomal protein S18 acetylase RimI-like enzyme
MSVIVLSEEHVAEATSLLVSAFTRDPILLHYLPDVDKRHRFFGLLINDLIRSNLSAGTVFALAGSGKLEAVAVWAPPNPPEPSLEDKQRSDRTFQQLLAIDESATEGIMSVIQGLEAFHPIEPHWHLFFVGVSSHLKRQGLGSTLIEHVHRIADESHASSYLESPFFETRAFYESLGYKVTREIREFGATPPLWTYFRSPR